MAPDKRRKLGAEAPDLVKRAHQVVANISKGCQAENGFGGFSISLYDTAWLSMISKADAAGVPQWVLPRSFKYMLREQHDDGSWGTNASPVDGILNTMAGLLSLLAHRDAQGLEDDNELDLEPINYDSRITRATAVLSKSLNDWDVDSALHVGFEVLVPSLLHQLAQRGIDLDFPGKAALMRLHKRKLSKFRPEMVTSKHQTTLLHSLEGLIGKVDFDQLSHHCTEYGGMLGSPASTAAYLIHSTKWDDAAEKYLKNVIRSYGDCGGVPSGFPTPVFEASWTISTLLASGYDIDDFASVDIETIGTYLKQLLENQKGLLGFAPGFLPDADDTARSLIALTNLGIEGDPSALVKGFEAAKHFQTYKLERDPSFSANANILLALLTSANPAEYGPQIEKSVKFLLSGWEDEALRDKWNLASEYTEMLLSSALVRLLEVWSEGLLETFPTELIKYRLPIVLCQLFSRTLNRQSDNGSWSSSLERTAYSVLLLAYMLRLPWLQSLREIAEAALLKGREYLTVHSNDWAEGDFIWIEKVTYKLPALSETYCLAAMKASTEEKTWTPEVMRIFDMPEKKLLKMSKFFGRLPLFQAMPEKSMVLAVAEAHLYSGLLRTVRLDIFPRDEMAMTEDKYLEYIPIAWTSVNSGLKYPLSGKIMWDMMVISMLNYQADEYMESVVAKLPGSSLAELKATIRAECLNGFSNIENSIARWDREPQSPESEDSRGQSHIMSLQEVNEVIRKYIRHIRNHRCITSTEESTQKQVAAEIHKFLLAHMSHNADNARMRAQKADANGNVTSQSYFDWVRTTGAHDTSCPYSFSFFSCLISKGGSFAFSSIKQKFFARALGLHLATMCRQYNDYGSRRRDTAEKNLNSLDFSEFNGDLLGNATIASKI
ncbi:Ent-kaurene synthase [Penicillium verhagenii]|nr:Ent-kaurene synthase [Penicillium verhagenii]